jgi:arylamine N-acetyltransferase
MRGAVLTTIDAQGKSQRTIESLPAYSEVLTQDFGLQLDPSEIEQLWAQVWPAHVAWVQSASSG